jgi:hypothetical protein
MSTAEEMEAGRKRSQYFANLGTSRPHPKSNPTGADNGITPRENDGTNNVILFGPTGSTGVQGDGAGTGPTGDTWLIGNTGPTGHTGPTGTQPGPNTSQARQGEQQPGPNGPAKRSEAGDKRGGSSQRPVPIPPTFANFPTELTSLPNWVLWRYLPPKSHGQKWRKVPFQPNGKTANSTDRSTWSRFEDCRTAYAQGGFDGLGFVFDGEIGTDGLCYCGVDFDGCIEDVKDAHSLARSRIRQLNTYTEGSVSGTGFHCIARAKPLDRIVKFDGVEIYTSARYFVFTGCSFGEIKAAPAEVAALVDEVRAKETAAKQQLRSGLSSNGLTDPCKNAKPSQASATLAGAPNNLADEIKTQWFEILSPQAKDEVVDCALNVIATNTPLLEFEADGGNNAEYFKLTTSVARSGAPNVEDIFVKHASRAKNADTDEVLRQHFSRCRASQPSGNREITVGTLLLLAQQNGANFDQWKRQAPSVPALPPGKRKPLHGGVYSPGEALELLNSHYLIGKSDQEVAIFRIRDDGLLGHVDGFSQV